MAARERDVGIDDLLGDPADREAEAQSARPEPTATLGSGLLRAALVAALIAGAGYVVLLPMGLKIPYILLFSVFFALLALRRALKVVEAPRLTIGAEQPEPVTTRIDPTRVADGVQLALGRWETRLSWTERDPQRFMTAVRPRLADIADERLRQRHGVTRADDPRRARELMGERLWMFLFSPLASTPNPKELAAVVDDMETL
jgi:hypothetical protein